MAQLDAMGAHEPMSEHLDLQSSIRTLTRRWRSILLVTLLVTGAAVGIALLQPRQYDATATLLTGQDKGIGDIDSILSINQTAQSLATLATDRVVVARAMRDAKVSGPIEQVLASVSAEVPPNAPVIRLTVRGDDPVEAAELATSIAQNFSELINERAGSGSSLSAFVWQEAAVPRSAASPNLPLIGLAAVVIGLLAAVGIAFAREHLDGRWRSEQDVEQALGVPVLATIPVIRTRGRVTTRRRSAA